MLVYVVLADARRMLVGAGTCRICNVASDLSYSEKEECSLRGGRRPPGEWQGATIGRPRTETVNLAPFCVLASPLPSIGRTLVCVLEIAR